MLRFPEMKMAALLGSVVLLLFLLTTTTMHSGDDLQWIRKVESARHGKSFIHPASTDPVQVADDGGWPIQPRYLLAVPHAMGIVAVAEILGWSGRTIEPILVAHALLGALGVVFFYLALSQIVPGRWSLAAALGLTVSQGWWYYSTHADYPMASYALSSVFLYFLLVAITRRPGRGRGVEFVLGLVNAWAALSMMTRIVLVPVAVVGLLAASRRNVDRPLRRLSSYGAGLALGSLLTVCALTFLSPHGGDPLSAAGLWSRASHAGAEAHRVEASDVPKVVYGMAKGLIGYPWAAGREPREVLAREGRWGRALLLAWYSLVSLVVLAPLLLLLRQYRHLGECTAPVGVLTLWLLLEVPFVVYWEPTYLKWLLGMLLAWWGLVAILAAKAFPHRPSARRGLFRLLIGLVVFLLVVNLLGTFLPAARMDDQHPVRVAQLLAGHSDERDLFVVEDSNLLDFMLPYFADRRALSVGLLRYAEQGDEAAVRKSVRTLAAAVAESGGRVFLLPCEPSSHARLQALVGPSLPNLQPLDIPGLSANTLTICQATPG